MENLLQTGFERRILRKMTDQNNKRHYNKEISWNPQFFQKTDIRRESVNLRTIQRKLTLNLAVVFNFTTDISFLKYVTKIFSQQTFLLMNTSSVFVFRRRLDQDEYIRLSYSSAEDVLIKTSIFILAICLQVVFKTFSRRLQDVLQKHIQDTFKTSSRRLAKTSSRCLQNVFKTSTKTFPRHLQDVLKTSSRRLQDIFKTSCKDAFNMFWRHIISLNCLPSSRICLGHTSEKFLVSVENLQVW